MRKNIVNTFWLNVDRYQKLHNVSDQHIARTLGISLVSWGNYRRQRPNATLKRIEDLAEALDVTPVDLMEVWTIAEWQQMKKEFKQRK